VQEQKIIASRMKRAAPSTMRTSNKPEEESNRKRNKKSISEHENKKRQLTQREGSTSKHEKKSHN
jgi:hypothetical protein